MRISILILLSAASAYFAGVLLLVRFNPEFDFWHGLEQRRDREIARTRSSKPDNPLILFAGGSSCAFSINPSKVTQTTGRESFNLGGPAHAGAEYLTDRALDASQSGDLLVLALETHFLTTATDLSSNSLGLALGLGNRWDWSQIRHASRLRPGATFTATWLAKNLTGRMEYRYGESNIRDRGWLENPTPLPESAIPQQSPCPDLSRAGRAFLHSTLAKARRRGVTLVYSLPWQLASPENAGQFRASNLRLLNEIAKIIPVLDDPDLGIRVERNLFSDTINHLSPLGSQKRSATIANSLETLLMAERSR